MKYLPRRQSCTANDHRNNSTQLNQHKTKGGTQPKGYENCVWRKEKKKPTNVEEINRDNFQIFLKIIGCKRNMYNVRRKSPDFLWCNEATR